MNAAPYTPLLTPFGARGWKFEKASLNKAILTLALCIFGALTVAKILPIPGLDKLGELQTTPLLKFTLAGSVVTGIAFLYLFPQSIVRCEKPRYLLNPQYNSQAPSRFFRALIGASPFLLGLAVVGVLLASRVMHIPLLDTLKYSQFMKLTVGVAIVAGVSFLAIVRTLFKKYNVGAVAEMVPFQAREHFVRDIEEIFPTTNKFHGELQRYQAFTDYAAFNSIHEEHLALNAFQVLRILKYC